MDDHLRSKLLHAPVHDLYGAIVHKCFLTLQYDYSHFRGRTIFYGGVADL